MRKKNFKGRCQKRKLSKCEDVCRTYDAIQYVTVVLFIDTFVLIGLLIVVVYRTTRKNNKVGNYHRYIQSLITKIRYGSEEEYSQLLLASKSEKKAR